MKLTEHGDLFSISRQEGLSQQNGLFRVKKQQQQLLPAFKSTARLISSKYNISPGTSPAKCAAEDGGPDSSGTAGQGTTHTHKREKQKEKKKRKKREKLGQVRRF